MKNLLELNQYRAIDWELRAHGMVGDANGGCFVIERDGAELRMVEPRAA